MPENNAAQDPQVTGTLPANYPIRILLHGLLVSAFKTNPQTGEYDRFEVGALNERVSGHSLQLLICERRQGANPTPISLGGYPYISLRFTQQHSQMKLRRYETSIFDPDDFRTTLDFEKRVHPRKVDKIQDKISPRLYIHDGVVHPLLRSAELLKNKQDFGQVAQVMAIDIEVPAPLPTGLEAELILHQNPDPSSGRVTSARKFDLKKNYNIVFRNDCQGGCGIGPSDPLDLNELKKCFNPPTGHQHHTLEHKYNDSLVRLWIEREIHRVLFDKNNVAPFAGLEDVFFHSSVIQALASSRYNPCGIGYFGYSNGLNDNLGTP